jgi:hypothetical protein
MKGDLAAAVNDQQHSDACLTTSGRSCSSSTSCHVKTGVSSSGVATGGRQFSKDDLKHLFTMWPNPDECETRVLLDSSMIPADQQPLQWVDIRGGHVQGIEVQCEQGPEQPALHGISQYCCHHLRGAISGGLVTALGRVTKYGDVEKVYGPLEGGVETEDSLRDNTHDIKPEDEKKYEEASSETVLEGGMGSAHETVEKDISQIFSKKRPSEGNNTWLKDHLMKKWAVEEGLDLEL